MPALYTVLEGGLENLRILFISNTTNANEIEKWSYINKEAELLHLF